MNIRTTLAIGLMTASSAAYCNDITIKGATLGMNTEDALLVLARAFEIKPEDFDIVRVTVGGVEKTCIFTPGFNVEFKDDEDGLQYCNMLTDDINLSMIAIQQDFQRNILKTIKQEDSISDKPIRQVVPLATFIDDRMVTLMFDSPVTEKLFSFNKGDFKVFAKGFVDAYGIPVITPGQCIYFNSDKCWDYKSSDVFISLFDPEDKMHTAPIIFMYKNIKINSFNF